MKNTFLVIEDTTPGTLIKPGQVTQICGRPQISVRPHRLRIDPSIAPFFTILDIKVETSSKFPKYQELPASQFMHGAGENFDIGIVGACMDVIMIVLNTSDKVPGFPKGVPLPFKATWACIIPPPSKGALDMMIIDGNEDLDSRIAHVPETVGRPVAVTRRAPPGFGWDPYGND